MFERCEYPAGTVDERRRDEMRVCGAKTEDTAVVVAEDLLECKHHRPLTVSISLQQAASPLYGSEALHAPSGLEVVALGDVVSVDVQGRESVSQQVADRALPSACGADQHDFGPAAPLTNSSPVARGVHDLPMYDGRGSVPDVMHGMAVVRPRSCESEARFSDRVLE